MHEKHKSSPPNADAKPRAALSMEKAQTSKYNLRFRSASASLARRAAYGNASQG